MSTTSSANPVGLPRSEAHHPGVLIGSWTLAAGLAAALVVVIPTASGRLYPDALVTAAIAAVGAVLGAVHGAVLARLARDGATAHAAHRSLTALAVALLGIGAAGLAGGGLALSAAAVRVGQVTGWAPLAIGVAGSVAVIVWASVVGWQAFGSAYHRWPEHRLGIRLVIGAFVLIVTTLMLLRPVLPWIELQVRPFPLVVLAALATLWIALPAVAVGLSLTRGRALSE